MASFVLLVAAIMFFIRTVTLLFVYVFSPIGLTLRLIPMFKDAHGKWRDALLKQSFYAPAFLIPLFAVFKILGDKGLSTLAQDAGIGTGLMKISAIQIIIMAMIASCIFIAQKFGAFGTGFATKWAGKGVNLLSKPAVGTTKLLGRGTLDVGRRAGRAISSSAAGQSISRGVGLLSSQVAGTRAVQGATSAARWAAGTAAGQAIRSSVASGARNVAKDFKSAVKDKVEHPLLYASDVISAGASKIGGVKGFNVMGATREERNKAKEEAKKKQVEERARETNRQLRELLTNATDATAIQGLVSGITGDTLKIIDLQIFADIPQAACALNMAQINALTTQQGRESEDARHKPRIRTNIINGVTTPFVINAPIDVQNYMNIGIGQAYWV